MGVCLDFIHLQSIYLKINLTLIFFFNTNDIKVSKLNKNTIFLIYKNGYTLVYL